MSKFLITKKRGGLWARLAAFMVVLIMTTAQVNAQTVQVDGSSSYTPTQIVNGDFSTIPFEAFKYNGVVYSSYPATGIPHKSSFTEVYPNGVNGGWNTSENQTFGNGLFEFYDGNQTYGLTCHNYYYVEMNAHNSAVLSQDLTTKGGDVILWTLKHAARHNHGDYYQRMRVDIGAPIMNGDKIVAAVGVNENTDTKIVASTLVTYKVDGVTNPAGATYGYAKTEELAGLEVNKGQPTDCNAWKDARGVYVVPEGQTVTRFGFVAYSMDSPSAGNLLDDITFSTLVGNLKAVPNNDGSVTVTGYWGDKNTDKKLVVKIGSNVLNLAMSSVLENNFTVTIPSETIGSASTLEVYHQDYEQAKRTVVITNHRHCICGDENCDGTGEGHQIMEWNKWTSTNSLPTTAGNWYLDNDVTLTATYQPVNGVNLCLNGHVVNAGTGKGISVTSGCTFQLTDCNRNAPHRYVADANGVWQWNDAASGGTAYESLAARPTQGDVIIVKGGAITGVNSDLNDTYHCIWNNGGTVRIYNCNFIGNRAINGPCVHSGGLTNITRSIMAGNYGSGSGGAVMVDGNTTATLTDCDISFNRGKWGGGVNANWGSGIYLVMNGGRVAYNTADSQGGGVAVYHNAKITGTKIINNTNTGSSSGGGLYFDHIQSNAGLTLGGDVVISGNKDKDGNENNLYLTSGKTATVSSLASGASIGVTTATVPTISNPVAVTGNNTASVKQYFTSDNGNFFVTEDNNKAVQLAVPVAQIVDGESYATVQEAVNAAENSNTIKMLANSTENVEITSDKDITLDLKGKTITSKTGKTTITNRGTLTVIDSSEGNGIITGVTDESAGIINYATLNMYAGKVIGNYLGVLDTGKLTLGGKAVIEGNGTTTGESMNLGLTDGTTFSIATGTYAPTTMHIGITTQTMPVANNDIPLTDANENYLAYSEHFFGDNSAYTVFYNDTDKKLYLTNDVTIIVTADPDEGGEAKLLVTATGEPVGDPEHILYGTSVTIKAIPTKDYAFKGWFIKGTNELFCKTQTYTFDATTPKLELEARFTDQVIWIRVKKGN